MQPAAPDPEPTPELSPDPISGPSLETTPPRPDYRRLTFALLAYAALAVLASVRLDGKPRLVVWLFLGLFAIKSLLVVLKQRAD